MNLLLFRHSHNICDQFFSRISARLAKMNCVTIEKFIEEIKQSYDPEPNVKLLKRSLNIHEFLEGCLAKHQDGMSLPRQFNYFKDPATTGTTSDGVGTSVTCSEWSNSEVGDPQFPLQRMPSVIPNWNANRRVFSKWETRTQRTTDDVSDKILVSAESQIMDLEILDFQRNSWKSFLGRIRRWENLEAVEYPGWWPLTNKDVTEWIEGLDKPVPDDDGTYHEASRLLIIGMKQYMCC